MIVPDDAAAVVAAYRTASDDERRAMVDELSGRPDVADGLNAYGHEMAVRAVRRGSVADLAEGLIALGAASSAVDFRENLIVVALLFHSATMIGADFATVVESVADLIPVRLLERMRRFPERNDRDRDIAAMGYTTRGSGEEFAYVLA